MRRHFILGTSLLFLAASASAQEAVTLRLGGRQGTATKNRTVSEMFVGGAMAAMMGGGDTTQPFMRRTEFTTQTLTAVTGDTLTVTDLTDSTRVETPMNPAMAAMMGGAATPRGQSKTTKMGPLGDIYETVMRNDLGEVTNTSGPAPGRGRGRGMGGPPGGGASSRTMFMLPTRPVRVGDSWTDTLITAAAGGEPASTMMATYQLQRIDNSGGRRIAVIAINGSMSSQTPQGEQAFTLTGELQFDVAGNRPSGYTMTMTGTMQTPQGPAPMRMQVVSAPVS